MPRPKIDIYGKRYGFLTVIDHGTTNPLLGKRVFRCRCDCGKEREVSSNNLVTGNTKSCGCSKKDIFKGCYAYKHGLSGKKIYYVWEKMMYRCYNKKCAAYKNYGGRGITVCEEWHEVWNFVYDMDDVPEGKSLDRIDNNGNYEPSNCRWATSKEQANNRRR